ncbi:unnamed protein product [Caenorhabditis auriculariae]|uniref:Major facilitator superfamily (MFS) profile domain-containing protein n=1 Tax=Caenorhabditis auriculariae TaxID=2777116 RepID=A0A8S1GY50_9PELO|nr:unnamed protein product [Caenorhabditis auriculariae]
MSVDSVFQLDRYQFIVLAFNEFAIFTMLSNVIFNVFGVAHPKILGCDDVLYNGTTPWEICAEYDSDVTCVHPVVQYEFKSAAVEFQEFCNRPSGNALMIFLSGSPNRAKFSTTLQMMGIMLGSAIGGYTSDRFGRRKMVLLYLTSIFLSTVASSFGPTMEFYISFRFLVGIFCGALITVANVFVMENLPSAHRLWMSTVVTWAPNYILFSVFAYFAQEWRTLARMSSVMTVFAILICAFGMPESAKYLVQKRDKKGALASLTFVNQFKSSTKKFTPEQLAEIIDVECASIAQNENKKRKNGIATLYSTRFRKPTIVVSLSMFALSFITYGLLFNYDALSGSIFVNMAISGVFRYIVGALVALLDHFWGLGRKRLHFSTITFIMTCMLSTFLILVTGNSIRFKFFTRAFTLLAFGTTGCMYLLLLLVTAEIFPTSVRNVALGHVNVWGRMGNILGPMIFNLFNGNSYAYLILVILSVADLLIFHIFIPETKGRPLPNETAKDFPKKNEGVELLALSSKN